MIRFAGILSKISKNADNYFIIHYSSQSLYDGEESTKSPRVTSIAVMQFSTKQTKSFSLHAIAEELQVSPDEFSNKINLIEKELLRQFFDYVKDNKSKYWLHWNMKSQIFGFEHIEQRYRVTNQAKPSAIPLSNRININDVLIDRFGDEYIDNPKMLKLMELNGDRPKDWLTGPEEAEYFKKNDFIRMHASTLAKVNFFHFVIEKAIKGKLKTKGRSFGARVDGILESRSARIAALFSSLIGILGTFISTMIWIIH